jgi:hypothetical protein
MRTAVTVIVVLASVGLVAALGVWLSRRSPAALSEEDTPLRPLVVDGVGRPAGPDAEAMGVLDRGVIVTGPPPPGGVPTDAPRPRPAPRRWRPRSDRSRSRATRRGRGPVVAAEGAEQTSSAANRLPGPTSSTGDSERPPSGSAGMWGVDLSRLSPSDAAVALRGLERRYRELFEPLGEDESPDELAHRRTANGWSVIDHIAAATQAIAAANRALARVLIAETPTVQPDEVDPAARPEPAIARASVDELLAALGREARAAADRIESVPAGSWSRTATVDDGSGRTITALDIARAAVGAGVGHLRAAGNVVAAVRGSPDSG